MAVVEVAMHDFSGGYSPRLASTEFTDRQWATLRGVVLESAAVVRTQWACQKVGAGTGFKQIGSVGRWLVGIKTDGSVHYLQIPGSAEAWDDTRVLTWTSLAGVTADATLRILCRIPLPDAEPSTVVSGLLLNTPDDTKPAYAVYEKDGGPPVVVSWSDRWPDVDVPGEDMMPAANVGSLWGDFLVLGDVVWTGEASPAEPFRHEHAIWFSEPAVPTSWDPVNVVRTTPTGLTSRNVMALITIDAGLLVFTGSGLTLLRGTADDFDREDVRFGIAGRIPDAPCYWPATGGAAWVTNSGEIWQTNGERFSRLDDHLFLDRNAGVADQVAAWGQYLVAERDGKLLCFTLFDDEGAWTELVAPSSSGVASLHPLGDQLYFIDRADGAVWRFNRRDDAIPGERGHLDGDPVTATIATRTLEASDGHDATMWHRFGFRAEGPGTVVDVTVRPGPALDSAQPTLVAALNEVADVRHEQVVPGHGPSAEASAALRVEGDVSVEQVSFWYHRGRGRR